MRSATKKAVVRLFAVALQAQPIAASASLIDNGGSTTDTDSGLVWLDLTATQGLSVSAALAAYGDEGYRCATDLEVSTFLASFGIEYAFSLGDIVELTPSSASVTTFLSLLGVTYSDGFGDAALGGFKLDGLDRSAYLCISNGGCAPLNFVFDRDISSGDCPGCSGVGQFLVRPVHEPGTLALLGLGLVGLGLTRRRRAN